MTEKESRFPLQGLRKTVFAKTPTTGKIWRDFGHALFFCFHFIQRDVPQPIILDMDGLHPLSAGLIRGIHIDGRHQFTESIRGKFFNMNVLVRFPDELFNILDLLFLFMNLLLQILDLGFEVFLFHGVVFAHHGESFIIQPTGYIVLVNTDEKTVKLSDSLFSLCQPLLMQPQRFFALHTELLLHLGTEISFVC